MLSLLFISLHLFIFSKASDFVIIPKNEVGPCTLLNNGMKCTSQGYFELIQCDKESCYCVQPNNGEIAYETKIGNPRMAPTCSVCYNRLNQLYSNGQPSKDVFIPLCDNKKGNFQSIQCTPDREMCFCVDNETGKEIPGTKRKGTDGLRCDRTNERPSQFDPNNGMNVIPVASPSCKLDRDRGFRCATGKPIVEWHFDVSTFQCLAFEYLGCGGNANRYPTEKECYDNCKYADLSGCSGMRSPARDSQGKTITCGQSVMPVPAIGGGSFPFVSPPFPPKFPINPDSECPNGHKCVMGAFIGMCCDRENEDLFQRNFWPTCRQFGRRPYQWNDHQVLIGKNCSDNFCPFGKSCEQGEIFAYCC